jgi:hypothetical protein
MLHLLPVSNLNNLYFKVISMAMKFAIDLLSVESSDCIYGESGQNSFSKSQFQPQLLTNIKRYSKGYLISVTTEVKITKAQTGETCDVKVNTVFRIVTGWTMPEHKTHELTVALCCDLNKTAFAHLRAFIIEKNKEAVFNNEVFPFQSSLEIKKMTMNSLLAIPEEH